MELEKEQVSHRSNLEDLVNKSVYILREAKAQFKNPCVLWSTGKDSTVMLSLIRESFYNTIPWDVVHIDTAKKFKEMYVFRDKIQKMWEFNIVIAKNEQTDYISIEKGWKHFDCCNQLKTLTLRNIIEEKGYDGVVVSIRRDEHYMRNIERLISPRDKKMQWNIVKEKEAGEEGDSPFESLQDVSLWSMVESDWGENFHHARVHPFLTNPPWREIDTWEYVKNRNISYNPLYSSDYVAKNYPQWKGKRFRSLGCQPCTLPISSDASTVDEIIEELKKTKIGEREGRAQDKERIMRRLRALGYT